MSFHGEAPTDDPQEKKQEFRTVWPMKHSLFDGCEDTWYLGSEGEYLEEEGADPDEEE